MIDQEPSEHYDAGNIQVLKGLEAVRKRPGMYIGSTSTNGLHHLVYEVVDNSIDEAMAKYATRVDVTIHEGDSITVRDDGRGIPVDMHVGEGLPGVEVAMTILHAGGKFDGNSYKVAGGLHGVGVSVVNALSSQLKVWVRRDGHVHYMDFNRGTTVTKLKVVEDIDESDTGTTVWFQPDDLIFSDLAYKYEILANRLRELAYLNKGVVITLRDERVGHEHEDVFVAEGGLREMVEYLNHRGSIKALHPEVLYIDTTYDDIRVELAMQYNDGYQETIFSFVNNIHTHEGGTHLTGLKSGLTRMANIALANSSLNKKDKETTLTGEDVREGLTAVLSIKVFEPQFEGQTKTKLGNSEAENAVRSVVVDLLGNYMNEHPKVTSIILEKVLSATHAREAAKKARDMTRKKSALDIGNLPGKLADCSSNNPEISELYLVEGDSAGGCFAGRTEVALADGRSLSFIDMVAEQRRGLQHCVYSIDEDGCVCIREAVHARRTIQSTEVWELILDSGESVVGTGDHPVMLRSGDYRALRDLKKKDFLMPLYRKDAAPQETIDTYNHQVDSIRCLEKTEDVYDIEVPGTHNFALSAGFFVHNSAKMGRNREFQAILPLRGKILNVEKARLDRVFANEEIRMMVTAIGAGIRDDFDVTKVRYHKIILMADADVDGAHIRTLLLTFFYRQMPELISAGYMYMAVPPLYRIARGKDVHYAYSDTERNTIIEAISTPENRSSLAIQRYKGLGEMNPSQLWETTMDPKNRTLMQVQLEDAILADDVFQRLMGDDVEPRRLFIEQNAQFVSNLDV